jgi:hypothetical protein
LGVYGFEPQSKARISGCIKESLEYPNIDFLNLSDYEVFRIRDLKSDELEKRDLVINLLKKLYNKDKDVVNKKPYKLSFEKIDLLLTTEKIYYSSSDDGKIYKAAIMISKNKGLAFEMDDGVLLENFEFTECSADSFMSVDRPKVVLEKLKSYGMNNKLNENHKRFINILEND